jgi:tetratricopeptide (TPR) repeat protein
MKKDDLVYKKAYNKLLSRALFRLVVGSLLFIIPLFKLMNIFGPILFSNLICDIISLILLILAILSLISTFISLVALETMAELIVKKVRDAEARKEFLEGLDKEGYDIIDAEKYTKIYLDKVQKDFKAQIFIDEAEKFLAKGEYKGAINILENAITVDPNSRDTWMIKGWLSSKLKRYSDAVECYNKIIVINPELHNKGKLLLWFYKGYALFKSSKFDDALFYMNKTLELDPKQKNAWKIKGDILLEKGDREEAEKCFEKAK